MSSLFSLFGPFSLDLHNTKKEKEKKRRGTNEPTKKGKLLFYWFLSFSRFASWLGGSSAPAKQSTLFPRGEKDRNIVELYWQQPFILFSPSIVFDAGDRANFKHYVKATYFGQGKDSFRNIFLFVLFCFQKEKALMAESNYIMRCILFGKWIVPISEQLLLGIFQVVVVVVVVVVEAFPRMQSADWFTLDV